MTEETAAVETADVTDAGADVTAEAPETAAPEAPSFDWADMRGAMTGGDEGMEKVFGRYRSADAFAKAFMAQRQKLSERAEPAIPTLDENSTPEDIAAYRQAMGIAENVDDYGVNFGEGFEMADGDAEVLTAFKEHMHSSNVPPNAAQAAVEWYQNLVETDRQAKNEMADTVHSEASDALKAEWGREFDANQNAIKSYLNESLGAERADEMREMRMADGSYLMDNPDVLRLLVQPASDYMGGDLMVAGDQATAAKTLNERKNELMALRLSDPVKYKSDEVQEEVAGIFAKLGRLNQ